MSWLVVSILLSVVLTVLANVALRLFPDAGHRIARRASERANFDGSSRSAARLFLPWKTMIVASVVLTIVINVILWIR
jgi:hypothetical protein